jgi:hypothetical protein
MEPLSKRQERTKGIDIKKNKWKMRRDNHLKDNSPYHKKWGHNEPKQKKRARICINLIAAWCAASKGSGSTS